MNCGIYKISWRNNGYYYYGQALNFKRRKSGHISTLKKNKHGNRRVQRIFNKYGLPDIVIIEDCIPDLLDEREQYYLSLHFGKRYCCNLSKEASSQKGLRHSEKTKKKLSLKHTGKKLSEAHKQSIKAALLNVRFDREKLSKSFTGSNNPRAKKVLDTSTGKIYDTLVDAVKDKGLKYKRASDHLRGRSKNKTTLVYA
jgi:group I intron endonuclease